VQSGAPVATLVLVLVFQALGVILQPVELAGEGVNPWMINPRQPPSMCYPSYLNGELLLPLLHALLAAWPSEAGEKAPHTL